MIIKLIILLMANIAFIASTDNDISYNQLVLSDWDSTLYNKPLCVPIPSNMSLCKNINYKEMKIPNLLGHETMDEIEYQASVWLPLLSIQCNKDTQLFLCSLFAPVCVEQQSIYPCRSLCESVKQSCSNKMLSYGYQWPEIFNCSKFPEDNGLCIQADTQQTTVPTTTSTTTSKPIMKNNKKTQNFSNQLTCHGCTDTANSIKNIVTSYCNSDLVIRGRIPNVKQSRFDLFKPKMRPNKTMSQYITIPRRDRKVLKGAKLALQNYLNERSLVHDDQDYVDEDDDGRNDELDIYLLSNYHLNLAQSLLKNTDMKRLSMRSLNGQMQCKCDKLKKSLKQKMKYLIFASVLRVKKVNLKPVDRLKVFRNKRAVHNSTGLMKQRRHMNGRQQKFHKLIYINAFYSWASARSFIDYIEDDTISKENMCDDVASTVEDIRRVRNLLI